MKKIFICATLLGVSVCCVAQNQSLTIKRGETGMFELSCAGGTGHQWALQDKAPKGFVITHKTQVAEPGRAGGPVTYLYKIKVGKKVTPGQYQLQFKLVRSWEPVDPNVQKAVITVTVAKK